MPSLNAFVKRYKTPIFITAILLGIIAASFLASGLRRHSRVCRIYRSFYNGQESDLQWTKAGMAWWNAGSRANHLRAAFLLGRPIPWWGAMTYVRWYDGAVFAVSRDIAHATTIVIYRPNPLRPVSYSDLSRKLARQVEREFSTHVSRFFGDGSPIWTMLPPVIGAAVPVGGGMSARQVTLPHYEPPMKGAEVQVIVGGENWIVLGFSMTGIDPKHVASYAARLAAAPSIPQLKKLYTDIGAYRPTGTQDAAELSRLYETLGRWGKMFYFRRQRARELQQDLFFYSAYATAMTRLRLFDLAIEGWAEMIALKKNDPLMWRNLGDAAMLAGHDGLAIQAYQKLITLAAKRVESRMRLANAYEKAGDYADALKTFQAAYNKFPKQAAFLEGIAHETVIMGKFDDGIKLANEALKLDPSLPRAYEDLCAAKRSLGLFDDATAACRQSIRLAPRAAGGYIQFGILNFSLKKWAEALRAFTTADRLGPPVPEALGYESVLYSHFGQLDRAQRALELAVRLEPRSGALHNLLAQVYAKRGNKAAVAREQKVLLSLSAAAKPTKPHRNNPS